jgi:hypothetical protein
VHERPNKAVGSWRNGIRDRPRRRAHRSRTYTLVDGGVGRPVAAGELIEGWRLEFIQSEGRWSIDPIRAHNKAAIGTAELSVSKP